MGTCVTEGKPAGAAAVRRRPAAGRLRRRVPPPFNSFHDLPSRVRAGGLLSLVLVLRASVNRRRGQWHSSGQADAAESGRLVPGGGALQGFSHRCVRRAVSPARGAEGWTGRVSKKPTTTPTHSRANRFHRERDPADRRRAWRRAAASCGRSRNGAAEAPQGCASAAVRSAGRVRHRAPVGLRGNGRRLGRQAAGPIRPSMSRWARPAGQGSGFGDKGAGRSCRPSSCISFFPLWYRLDRRRLTWPRLRDPPRP
jgi:hypothetical protein